MAKYNAVYTLLWKRGEDGFFRVVDDYTSQARKRFSFLNVNYAFLTFLVFLWPSTISDAYGTV